MMDPGGVVHGTDAADVGEEGAVLEVVDLMVQDVNVHIVSCSALVVVLVLW